MTFNYENALVEIERINQLTDKNEALLRIDNLVKHLDISASGDITVLYSGLGVDVNGESINIKDVVSGNIRVIDDTDAAQILKSEKFQELVSNFIGSLDRGEPGNKYLYDAPGGAWDSVSDNFVRSGSGELMTVIGDGAK